MSKAMISKADGKILLAKTIRSFYDKSQLFVPKSIHSLRPNCHSTCPLSQRIIFSKRTSRLYESLLISHVGATCVSKTNLLILEP